MPDISPVRVHYLATEEGESVVDDSDLNARILALVDQRLRELGEAIREHREPWQGQPDLTHKPYLLLAYTILEFAEARPPREPAQDVKGETWQDIEAASAPAPAPAERGAPHRMHATVLRVHAKCARDEGRRLDEYGCNDLMDAADFIDQQAAALSALQARVRELEASLQAASKGVSERSTGGFELGRAAGFAEGVAKVAAEARRYAAMYTQSSDGRNTFTMLAEWADRLTPAPTAAQSLLPGLRRAREIASQYIASPVRRDIDAEIAKHSAAPPQAGGAS